MFPVPPLFKAIHDCSGTDWREMYQVFNMGHRMEIYLQPELADKVMPAKANFRKSKTFVLAIMAGALIAFGAQVSLTVMTGTAENLSWGIAKLVGAMTFATGLMMVVLTGAELFTGNVMMTFSVIEKKITFAKLF